MVQLAYKPAKPYKHQIIDAIRKTWHTRYLSVSFNTYPVFKKRFSHPEVDHTDGIGTKGAYHWQAGTFREAVLDGLAMNLNDLAMVRAHAYKLSNHITVPEEDVRVLRIVHALARECARCHIAIVGGENSFHDNMDGLDISMTVSGFITKPRPNMFRAGDVLIGFKSSGLHSNGFTTVRSVFGRRMRPEFTVPTVIYSDTILSLAETFDIGGMMHITGGAFTKLKDVLPRGLQARVFHPHKLFPHQIFFELHERGVSTRDMYRTFNCGIGFIISVRQEDVARILKHAKRAAVIGEVTRGEYGIHIASAFGGRDVVF